MTLTYPDTVRILDGYVGRDATDIILKMISCYRCNSVDAKMKPNEKLCERCGSWGCGDYVCCSVCNKLMTNFEWTGSWCDECEEDFCGDCAKELGVFTCENCLSQECGECRCGKKCKVNIKNITYELCKNCYEIV